MITLWLYLHLRNLSVLTIFSPLFLTDSISVIEEHITIKHAMRRWEITHKIDVMLLKML